MSRRTRHFRKLARQSILKQTGFRGSSDTHREKKDAEYRRAIQREISDHVAKFAPTSTVKSRGTWLNEGAATPTNTVGTLPMSKEKIRRIQGALS